MKIFGKKSKKYKSHLSESDDLILEKNKVVDINILLNRVRTENKKNNKKKLILFFILGILSISFFFTNY